MQAPEHSGNLAVHPSARATVDFGPFRFDVADRLLYRDSRQIPLPPRALAVLAHLVERPNQVVSKQALMDAVWKDTFVEEASLKEAISLIRQALEEDAQQPRFIQTIHRRGYRFVAPLMLSPSPAADPARSIATPARPPLRATFSWLIAAAALVLLVGGFWAAERRPAITQASRAVRFAIPITGSAGGGMSETEPRVAISPDGSYVIFVGQRDGIDRLYVRSLDRLDSRELPGTENGGAPFVSPDGQWVAFFADGHLKKSPIGGGPPLTVSEAPEKPAGGAWLGPRTIAVGSQAGLFEVPASGGTPSPLTRVDVTRGQIGHWWPHALPDGDSVMFTVWTTGLDRASLAVVSRRSHQVRTVYEGGADATYLRSGHLLFARSGGAATVPFDLAGLRVAGSTASLGLDADVAPFNGVLQAAVSEDGTLVYAPGSAEAPALRPSWFAAAGGTLAPLPLPPRPYRNLKLSPDGRHIAATINEATNYDLWIGDVERGTLTRLTFGGRNIEPVWSPDGQWVVYATTASRPFTMMRRRADGSGNAEQIVTGDRPAFPAAFTARGDALLYSEIDPATGFDLWVLPAGGKAWPFLRTPFEEESARFSPDSRAVAYASNESGRFEVYVRPFPGPGGRWQVSATGGFNPFWSADGHRLFYSSGDRLMAADITWGEEPIIGRPVTVAERRRMQWFGAAPDGRLLALEDNTRQTSQAQLNVVVNWLSAVRDRLGNEW